MHRKTIYKFSNHQDIPEFSVQSIMAPCDLVMANLVQHLDLAIDMLMPYRFAGTSVINHYLSIREPICMMKNRALDIIFVVPQRTIP